MRLQLLAPRTRGRCGCSNPGLLALDRIPRRPQRPILRKGPARQGMATRAPEPEAEEQHSQQPSEAGELLKRLVASRHSAKAFDTGRCEVPEPVLAEVLAMTLVRRREALDTPMHACTDRLESLKRPTMLVIISAARRASTCSPSP